MDPGALSVLYSMHFAAVVAPHCIIFFFYCRYILRGYLLCRESRDATELTFNHLLNRKVSIRKTNNEKAIVQKIIIL